MIPLKFKKTGYITATFILRAVASPTVLGGQEFHFPHLFLKILSIFLIFPQTFLIFFLILALWASRLPGKALAMPLFNLVLKADYCNFWSIEKLC